MQHYLKENRRILLIILLTIHDIQAQDPCLDGNHGTPSSLEKRSPLYVMDSSPICDRYILEGWYGARGYNMSTSPPALTYCGTLYPVWLNDQPPSEGQTGLLSACQVGFSANCDRSYNIEVKNCGEFLVYKLKPVDLCNSAYCFETPTVITSSVAITTFNAAASETSPEVTFSTHNIASTRVSTTASSKDISYPPNNPSTETSKDETYPPTNPSTETSIDVTYPPTNPSTASSIDVSYPPTNPSTETSIDVTYPPTNPSTASSIDVSYPLTNPSTKTSIDVTYPPTNPSTESIIDVTYPPTNPSTVTSKDVTYIPTKSTTEQSKGIIF
ncbi:mucin-2-like [Saccostrea cucullata]|uniref:mucin-2-like n=1 Tax=Saccostrea cuccullata TaxID=36930 RepID=UPI002ED08EC3